MWSCLCLRRLVIAVDLKIIKSGYSDAFFMRSFNVSDCDASGGPCRKCIMTSKDIIKAIKEALKRFGTYSYFDKGCSEVMDVYGIVTQLNELPVEECKKILVEVWNSKSVGNAGKKFVGEAVVGMQDVDEERWNKLMESDELQEAYDF